MKIRLGFVSNSSSASFTIYPKSVLTAKQIDRIKGYRGYTEILMRKTDSHAPSKAMKEAFEYIDDFWKVKELDDKVVGSTIMTNFDMEYYLLEVIKVPPENLKMDYDGEGSWFEPEEHEV